MNRHRPETRQELIPAIEALDLVMQAACVTRCPTCESRSLVQCPYGGTASPDCMAVKAGLAHLWAQLDQAHAELVLAGIFSPLVRP